MSGKRRHISLAIVLGAACLALNLSTATAMATSGEIIRSEANSDWTLASVAGTIDWTGCEHWVDWEPTPWEYPEYGDGLWEPAPLPYCGWLPYATLGPGSQPSDCESDDRDLADPGQEVDVIWQGQGSTRYQQSFFETADFEESEIPLGGPNDRLVCLSLIEIAPEYVPIVCIQIVGYFCPPFVMREFRHEVASALLTSVDPEEPEEIEDPELEEPEEGEEQESEETWTEPGEPKEPPLETTESQKLPAESTAPAAPSVETPPVGKPPRRRCPKGKQRVLRGGKANCRHRHRHRRHGRAANN